LANKPYLKIVLYVTFILVLCSLSFAWADPNYNYRRNLTNIPGGNLIFALNGTTGSDIDSSSTSEQYYGLSNAGVSLYYNDQSNTKLINSSDSEVYLVKTKPTIETSGTIGDVLIFFPLDNDGSEARDFSGNGYNASLEGSIVQDVVGIFDKAYEFDNTDYLKVTLSGIDGTYSVGIWFNITDFGDNNYLFDARAPNTGAGFPILMVLKLYFIPPGLGLVT